MKSIEEIFRQNLVRLRGSRTQEEVAESAGIPTRSYQNAEINGAIPQAPNRERIARAFGVEESDLFADPERYVPKSATGKVAFLTARETMEKALSRLESTQDVPDELIAILSEIDWERAPKPDRLSAAFRAVFTPKAFPRKGQHGSTSGVG